MKPYGGFTIPQYNLNLKKLLTIYFLISSFLVNAQQETKEVIIINLQHSLEKMSGLPFDKIIKYERCTIRINPKGLVELKMVFQNKKWHTFSFNPKDILVIHDPNYAKMQNSLAIQFKNNSVEYAENHPYFEESRNTIDFPCIINSFDCNAIRIELLKLKAQYN